MPQSFENEAHFLMPWDLFELLFMPASLKVGPQRLGFSCHFLLRSPQSWGVRLLFVMFLELIIDAVIPVKVSSLPGQNVDVNVLHSLSGFGAILHSKSKRSPLEMLFHHHANPLGCLKQISHFIRTQISEALHWPKGTHQDMSWDHRFPVHEGEGQFCPEKHHRGLDEMLAESE